MSEEIKAAIEQAMDPNGATCWTPAYVHGCGEELREAQLKVVNQIVEHLSNKLRRVYLGRPITAEEEYVIRDWALEHIKLYWCGKEVTTDADHTERPE